MPMGRSPRYGSATLAAALTAVLSACVGTTTYTDFLSLARDHGRATEPL